MNRRYTETYEEWWEKHVTAPDQIPLWVDTRAAWEYQQEKIDELRALLEKVTKEKDEITRAQRTLWEDR